MMYLVQEQENTTSLLSFFVVDEDGFLVDPYSIGFKIRDPSGTEVTPTSGYVDVTSIGRFDKGSFYAVDDCCPDDGWKVPVDATLGRWSIEWRWKLASTDSVFQKQKLFFFVEAKRNEVDGTGFYGLSYRAIVSPNELRATGLRMLDANDATLEILIERAQSYIEAACGQAFRPEIETYLMEGREADRIFMEQAIIGIREVATNPGGVAISSGSLTVNFARVDRMRPSQLRPDPRKQPAIAFQRSDVIFQPSFGRAGYFPTGRNNLKVTGCFGFLEANGNVPALIVEAATDIVFRNAVRKRAGAIPVPAGPMTSKTVDRHSVSFANTGSAASTSALATSRKVEEIIRLYRSPIGLGSPKAGSGTARLL